VGVVAHATLRGGHADLPEPLDGPTHQRAALVGMVRLDRLDELVADREDRVQ
jgi:hypothetical protein